MKFWLAGLGISALMIVTVFVLAPNLTASRQDQNTSTCPTDATFTQVWNTWSQAYLAENPGANGDDQVREWNMLMEGIGCPEWVNPFEDAIYGGTTTDFAE